MIFLFESSGFGILITPLLSQITHNLLPWPGCQCARSQNLHAARDSRIRGGATDPRPGPRGGKSVSNPSGESATTRGTATARYPLHGPAACHARPHTPPPHTAGCRRPPGPPDRSATGCAPWRGRRRRGRRSPPAAPSAPAPPSWPAADASIPP